MRIYDVAVFMLIFHVVGGAVTTGGIMQEFGFTGNELTISDEGAAGKIQDAQDEITGIMDAGTAASGNPIVDTFGKMYDWILQAIGQLANALNPVFYFVAWMPLLLQMAGVPMVIAWPFFLVFVALETIGLIQLATGKNLKEYE